MAIQTKLRNERGEDEELHPNDPRYWNGPYKYEPYPKQLFRATAGKYQTEDLDVCVVQSAQAHRALGAAWQESPDEARAYWDGLERDIAIAAAETNAAAERLSAKAQAELRTAEQATDEFVTDVVPKRIGWPKGKPRKKQIAEVIDGSQ